MQPDPLPFRSFGKIPRLTNLTMTITEKLDGTNACVVVNEDGTVHAQSRKRIITPEDDNYGFAAWVAANAEELSALGTGYHFGEWYGRGIQRNYGLDERRFALFNVGKWVLDAAKPAPSCCQTVPILDVSPFDMDRISNIYDALMYYGSSAAPGFDSPEGLMVYLYPLNTYLKVPLDPIPKGLLCADSND